MKTETTDTGAITRTNLGELNLIYLTMKDETEYPLQEKDNGLCLSSNHGTLVLRPIASNSVKVTNERF